MALSVPSWVHPCLLGPRVFLSAGGRCQVKGTGWGGLGRIQERFPGSLRPSRAPKEKSFRGGTRRGVLQKYIQAFWRPGAPQVLRVWRGGKPFLSIFSGCRRKGTAGSLPVTVVDVLGHITGWFLEQAHRFSEWFRHSWHLAASFRYQSAAPCRGLGRAGLYQPVATWAGWQWPVSSVPHSVVSCYGPGYQHQPFPAAWHRRFPLGLSGAHLSIHPAPCSPFTALSPSLQPWGKGGRTSALISPFHPLSAHL